MKQDVMNQSEKMERVEKLFDEIAELFPSNISLEIHNIKLIELDKKKWELGSGIVKETCRTYGTARRIGKDSFDITLFD